MTRYRIRQSYECEFTVEKRDWWWPVWRFVQRFNRKDDAKSFALLLAFPKIEYLT